MHTDSAFRASCFGNPSTQPARASTRHAHRVEAQSNSPATTIEQDCNQSARGVEQDCKKSASRVKKSS